MARYRVNNSFLSEKEYGEHLDSQRQSTFFFIGLALAIFIMLVVVPKSMPQFLELHKALRFTIVSIMSICTGFVFARLSKIILNIIALAVTLLILVFIGQTLWKFI